VTQQEADPERGLIWFVVSTAFIQGVVLDQGRLLSAKGILNKERQKTSRRHKMRPAYLHRKNSILTSDIVNHFYFGRIQCFHLLWRVTKWRDTWLEDNVCNGTCTGMSTFFPIVETSVVSAFSVDERGLPAAGTDVLPVFHPISTKKKKSCCLVFERFTSLFRLKVNSKQLSD
ncbi:unnamed protein product, partial [Nesidiocoris tenuis]